MIPSHLIWGVREYHEMQESGLKQTSCNQRINFFNAATASLAAPMTLCTCNHARNLSCKKPRRVETINVISHLASIRWPYQDLQVYCSVTVIGSLILMSRSLTSEFKA